MKKIAIVKASGGHEWTTAMNGTDQEVFKYFKVGTEVNIGNVKDDIRIIESCKINIPLSYVYDSPEGYHVYQISNREYNAAYCPKTKTWMWHGLTENKEYFPVMDLDRYHLNITQERETKTEEVYEYDYPYGEYITMDVFSREDSLVNLTEDDRIEIFKNILQGGSDITRELLDELGKAYGVDIAEIYKESKEEEN